MLLDVHGQYINGHLVVSAFRHNEVGVSFAGLYELLVHGFQYACIAFHDGFGRASAFHYIALDYTNQAFVGVGVYKYLQVHHASQLLVAQGKDAFNDDDFPGLDMDGFGLPGSRQV